MILLSFGRWSTMDGSFLSWKRIYVRGYRWTPFCWVTRRYPTTREYWNRVEKVVDLLKVQQQSVADSYNHGLYNGLELAIATMQDREPQYFHGSVGSKYTVEIPPKPNSFTVRVDYKTEDVERVEEYVVIQDSTPLAGLLAEVTSDPIAGGG